MCAITITVVTLKCLISESIQAAAAVIVVAVPVVVAVIKCVVVFLITHLSG